MAIVPPEIDAASDVAALASGKAKPIPYSDDVFLTLCGRLAEGRSVRSVMTDPDMPSQRALFQWLADEEHPRREWLLQHYARATDARAEAIFEETLGIADATTGAEANAIQAARLQVETRKWFLGKLRPKKYGDKLALTGGDEGDKPVSIAVEYVRVIASS